MKLFDYDDSSLASILSYATQMVNKTFDEILIEYCNNDSKSYDEFHSPSKTQAETRNLDYQNLSKSFLGGRKGGLGNLIEQCFFGYEPNSIQDADFNKVGLELKVSPYKKTNRGFSAKERLVITMINFSKPVEEDFYQSKI